MSLSIPDSGVLIAFGIVALLSFLAAAAAQFGADSRPTDWPDGHGPAGHHS